MLHVHPSISQVTEREKFLNLGTLGNFRLPLASAAINETDAIVRVKDGQIVAIGGLMTQELRGDRTGLPVLSSLPLVGSLFRPEDAREPQARAGDPDQADGHSGQWRMARGLAPDRAAGAANAAADSAVNAPQQTHPPRRPADAGRPAAAGAAAGGAGDPEGHRAQARPHLWSTTAGSPRSRSPRPWRASCACPTSSCPTSACAPTWRRLLPEGQARRLRAMVLEADAGTAKVAMADPTDIAAFERDRPPAQARAEPGRRRREPADRAA